MEKETEIPTIEEQKKIAQKYLKDYPKVHGEKWCLINLEWLNEWKDSISYKGEKTEKSTEKQTIEEINNSELVYAKKNEKKAHKIKRSLKTTKYCFVPSQLMEYLHKWFGGGPIINRYIAIDRVEAHPFFFEIRVHSEEEFKEYQFSRFTLFKDFLLKLTSIFEFEKGTFEIWLAFKSNPYKLLDESLVGNKPIGMVFNRKIGQEIIIFPAKFSGKKGVDVKLSILFEKKYGTTESKVCTSRLKYDDLCGGKPHEVVGVCGFKNLGNTCYMNSALQCLSRSESILNYFKSGDYKKDVRKNGKKVAENFGGLVSNVWSGKYGYFSPIECKIAAGRVDKRFKNYKQQDCSEFITVFLSGLHEDLNKKGSGVSTASPNTKIKMKDDYEFFKQKNDSIIVDKFNGVYKDEWFCCECKTTFTKFSTFTNLTLPIPIDRTEEIKFYFHLNGKGPTLCKIVINKKDTIESVMKKLGEKLEIPFHEIVVTLVVDKKIMRIIKPEEDANQLFQKNIIAYHIPKRGNEEFVTVRVKNKTNFINGFLITTKIGDTNQDLFDRCFNFMHRYLKKSVQHQISSNEELRKHIFNEFSIEEKKDIESFPPLFQLYYENSPNEEIFHTKDKVYFANNLNELILVISNASFCTHYSTEALTSFYVRGKDDVEKKFNLDELLHKFIEMEEIESKCEKCNKVVNSHKKINIWKPPETLIISFNRFVQINEFQRQKIKSFIDFPLEFDLGEILKKKDKNIYSLFGICNHMGELNLGHYTCYVKLNVKKEEKWFKFNDTKIEEVTDIDKKDAYVLFYQKKTKK